VTDGTVDVRRVADARLRAVRGRVERAQEAHNAHVPRRKGTGEYVGRGLEQRDRGRAGAQHRRRHNESQHARVLLLRMRARRPGVCSRRIAHFIRVRAGRTNQRRRLAERATATLTGAYRQASHKDNPSTFNAHAHGPGPTPPQAHQREQANSSRSGLTREPVGTPRGAAAQSLPAEPNPTGLHAARRTGLTHAERPRPTHRLGLSTT
jgi:hypothetical protein